MPSVQIKAPTTPTLCSQDIDVRYRQVVLDLESRGIMPLKAPSLEPTQKALGRILTPDQFNAARTIVVAGTNGKGSVCATLESLFLAAGETVGLFTSPHLEETTERIRINGQEISRELFCEAYRVVSGKTADLPLTHFEILTAMAAWIFFSGEALPPVKNPIFEVGLGGLWDSTNAIPHQNCIVTSLGYDHQNLLGASLEEIATNKFGIVTPGANVVHSAFPLEAKESLSRMAETVRMKTQSTWTESVPFECSVFHSEINEPQFEMKTPWGPARLSLAGERAAQNTATALTFFSQHGYEPARYLDCLKNIRWPGRMERVQGAQPCPTYLSGDHNSQGAKSLVQLLKHYKRKHLYLLAGIGKDKDLDGVLAPLFEMTDTSIFLTETTFKALPIADYGPWINRAVDASPDACGLLRKIQSLAGPDDLIVITGSLYLVGYLRSRIISTRVSGTS